MRWHRSLTILAMLAALFTAPSIVSAAPPNELRAASVVPVAGTTDTAFRLSVSYRSSSGNPASAVTATVGGRQVALALAAGTAVDGVWSATTRLPAGTWTVTYRAATDRGPQPTATAGPVNVIPLASSQPSSPGSDLPSNETSDPSGTPSTPAPAPLATARPKAGGSAPSQAPRTSAPVATASAAPALRSPEPRRGGHATRGTHRPSPSARGGAVTVESDAPDPHDGSTTPAQPGPEPVDMALFAGLVAVAAIGLLGVGWILIGGPRDRAEPAVADAAPDSPDPAVAAIPSVEARARRRARLRMEDDPILASLGLPEPAGSKNQELEGRLPRGKQRRKR
jgi:hypothetical protein